MPECTLDSFIKKHAPQISSTVRLLTENEQKILLQNGNTIESWDNIRVLDGFNPSYVRNSYFGGFVIIGRCSDYQTSDQGFILHNGIYNSTIINSVIMNDVTVNAVLYCNFYKIEDNAVLHNIGEMTTSAAARFGHGGLLDGSRKWLDIINENGGRAVIPFAGMTCADAYIWAKYRNDKALQERFSELADATCNNRMSVIGTIGQHANIRNVRIITDCRIEEYAHITGTEIIDDSTIRSTEAEKTFIGTGVQLRHTIIGQGNHIDSGTQLNSVLTGSCASVHQCARISHSVIGDNAAIGCCEIANSLIFPSHAQHHNSSFLIASMIGGQSNLASGTTVGSNHNSRTNDGELWASRGFWPGLCSSFKHNSRFASYTICAKADYPSEIDNPFPFSLLANDNANDALVICPAYYFTHNMYSFMRSKAKFIKRDKRIAKEQNIEHDPLAPDTVEEILKACSIIEEEAAKQWFTDNGSVVPDIDECIRKGRELLSSDNTLPDITVRSKFEKSKRNTIIRNPSRAWKAYRSMILWYAAIDITKYAGTHNPDYSKMSVPQREKNWINCGGQIVCKQDLDELFQRIKTDRNIKDWMDINRSLDVLFSRYELDRFCHALGAVAALDNIKEDEFTAVHLKNALQKAITVCSDIKELTYTSRLKDYTDPFRTMVCNSKEELDAVIGPFESDKVVSEISGSMKQLQDDIAQLIDRI